MNLKINPFDGRSVGRKNARHIKMERLTLQKSLPLWRHWYAVPFAIIVYPMAGSLLVANYKISVDHAHDAVVLWFSLLAVVTVQALMFLSTHWSIKLKVMMCFKNAIIASNADFVLIVPLKQHMRTEICSLQDAGTWFEW